MPEYLLNILIEELPALMAEEMLQAIVVASAPFAKPERARELAGRLRHQARRPPAPPPEVIEENPEKAAVWMRAQGIKVIEKDEADGT